MIGTGTDGVTQRLGPTRTFPALVPAGSVTPVSLAWLWPVTSRPDRGLAGLQLSEQTAAEMAAGGRLTASSTTQVIPGSPGSSIRAFCRPPRTWSTGTPWPPAPPRRSRPRARVPRPPSSGWPRHDAAHPSSSPWPPRTHSPTRRPLQSRYGQDGYAVHSHGCRGGGRIDTRQCQRRAGVAGGRDHHPSTKRTFREAGATSMLLSDATLPSGLTYTPDGFTTWADAGRAG